MTSGDAQLERKTRLAFYRGRLKDNSHALIGDRLICEVTDHDYSHVELLCSHGPAPSWATDGITRRDPMAWMLSSSLRDGGVREACRVMVPARWVVVEFDADPTDAIAYIRGRIGTPYGAIDLASFLVPFRVSTSADFCSEVVAAALHLQSPWHKSPGDLFDWSMQQPGARIVPDDGLLLPWSALAPQPAPSGV